MKRKLSRSLLYYDIIAFIFVFISIFVVFESVIKQIFVSYGTDRFRNETDVIQFDLSTGMTAVEEKKLLDYAAYAKECFKYSTQGYLYKAKYDDSAVLLVFPDGTIFGGLKKDTEFKFSNESTYEYFKSVLSSDIEKLSEFTLNGSQYIGLIELSRTGVRAGLSRDTTDLIYPLIVTGNKKTDFFYLIDLTRIFFIVWLFFILGIIAVFKIRLTALAASEIKTISDMLSDESKNIRTHGKIGEALKPVKSHFMEVNNLNLSSIDLNNALVELKNIVRGVTNEEFFIGTITGDKSITEQHEIYCTVMFLDIKGFTTISERHKAKSMKIGITIFSMVGEILRKYGGEIRKLLGDAALITFKDKDKDNPQSAISAVKAALEVLQEVDRLKRQLNEEHNPDNKPELEIDFNFRIGLDTGVVNEGLYGTPDNFEYGIIGDPVNTASRFEALNKQYYTNILLNENTFTQIASQTNCKPGESVADLYEYAFLVLDEARTKGKDESGKILTMYKPHGSTAVLAGTHHAVSSAAVNEFTAELNAFRESIKLWKEFKINGVEKAYEEVRAEWNKIIKKLAELDHKYGFHPVRQYLKLMVKFEEYEAFEKDIEKFIRQEGYELKVPSDDWLSNKRLARELDK